LTAPRKTISHASWSVTGSSSAGIMGLLAGLEAARGTATIDPRRRIENLSSGFAAAKRTGATWCPSQTYLRGATRTCGAMGRPDIQTEALHRQSFRCSHTSASIGRTTRRDISDGIPYDRTEFSWPRRDSPINAPESVFCQRNNLIGD
jgi:hypothetical protein